MGDTFADKQLSGEMGAFKEPGDRLTQVVGEGAKSFDEGDFEKALFLGMQASRYSPFPFFLKEGQVIDPKIFNPNI